MNKQSGVGIHGSYPPLTRHVTQVGISQSLQQTGGQILHLHVTWHRACASHQQLQCYMSMCQVSEINYTMLFASWRQLSDLVVVHVFVVVNCCHFCRSFFHATINDHSVLLGDVLQQSTPQPSMLSSSSSSWSAAAANVATNTMSITTGNNPACMFTHLDYVVIQHQASSLQFFTKARFPLPELTGDRFPLPVNTAHVDG